MHPARGQAAADLLPEQRRELIADEAVKQSARLLRIDKIIIDITWLTDALGNYFLSYFVEGNASCSFIGKRKQLLEMPGYRFSLTVRVGSEIYGFCVFAELFELVYYILVILHRNILRLKIVFYVNSKGALRQIAQVSHGGNDLIIAAEILLDRFGLSR